MKSAFPLHFWRKDAEGIGKEEPLQKGAVGDQYHMTLHQAIQAGVGKELLVASVR